MKDKTLGFCSALVGAAALFGCSSQANPDYEGEPLFKLQAKMVIDNPDAPDELVPAVAFLSLAPSGPRGQAFVQPVDYEGSFPASFELRLFEPPPDATLNKAYNGGEPTGPDEPRFAVGFITAVPPGTPETLNLNDASVYTHFAGLSKNVAIAYLESDAPAGSVASIGFNHSRAITAGYHLLRPHEGSSLSELAGPEVADPGDQSVTVQISHADRTDPFSSFWAP